MDIQNLTNVSTVVINSLLMLLKDNYVDVNSVVMQLSNNKDEAISPEVNLGELAQQTLNELQKAKAKKSTVPDTTAIVLALENVQTEVSRSSFVTMDADNESEIYAVDANELSKYIDDLIEAQDN